MIIIPNYRCRRCNYVYVENEQKICFEDLEEDFRCPRCRCSKNTFIKMNNSQ
ncbi:MAG: rubredoxin [Promethearchaeota archaeon]